MPQPKGKPRAGARNLNGLDADWTEQYLDSRYAGVTPDQFVITATVGQWQQFRAAWRKRQSELRKTERLSTAVSHANPESISFLRKHVSKLARMRRDLEDSSDADLLKISREAISVAQNLSMELAKMQGGISYKSVTGKLDDVANRVERASKRRAAGDEYWDAGLDPDDERYLDVLARLQRMKAPTLLRAAIKKRREPFAAISKSLR